MSLTSTTRHSPKAWLPVVAWTQVVLVPAGLLAVLVTPTAGVVAGVLAALVGLAVHALTKASRTMDRIFAEELDR